MSKKSTKLAKPESDVRPIFSISVAAEAAYEAVRVLRRHEGDRSDGAFEFLDNFHRSEVIHRASQYVGVDAPAETVEDRIYKRIVNLLC